MYLCMFLFITPLVISDGMYLQVCEERFETNKYEESECAMKTTDEDNDNKTMSLAGPESGFSKMKSANCASTICRKVCLT